MTKKEIDNTYYKKHSFITAIFGEDTKCVVYADDINYYDTWFVRGVRTKIFQVRYRCMTRTNKLNNLISVSLGDKRSVFAENQIRPSNDDEIKSLIKAIKFKEGFAKHLKFANDNHLYYN